MDSILVCVNCPCLAVLVPSGRDDSFFHVVNDFEGNDGERCQEITLGSYERERQIAQTSQCLTGVS